MGKLNFSDGWSVDTSGDYRVILGPDGYYVVGRGVLLPVDSEAEGYREIEQLRSLDHRDWQRLTE